jgi:hypothetical protein
VGKAASLFSRLYVEQILRAGFVRCRSCNNALRLLACAIVPRINRSRQFPEGKLDADVISIHSSRHAFHTRLPLGLSFPVLSWLPVGKGAGPLGALGHGYILRTNVFKVLERRRIRIIFISGSPVQIPQSSLIRMLDLACSTSCRGSLSDHERRSVPSPETESIRGQHHYRGCRFNFLGTIPSYYPFAFLHLHSGRWGDAMACCSSPIRTGRGFRRRGH